MRRLILLVLITLLAAPTLAQDTPEAPDDDALVFGMVLVGQRDDEGWSQAHYEAGRYVEQNYNARMLLHENHALTMNEQPMSEVVEGFINEGAELILLTSASFEAEALQVAPLHPDVMFLHIAGDSVLTGRAPENLGNLMAQMEWAKLLEGCAAALMTETGHIGYLGALTNSETRRLAASAYLGARHCFDSYRPDVVNPLRFEVVWVGFWYYIEGTTANPTTLTYNLYNNGADVVISGIDTQEALTVARRFREQGERTYALSYNSQQACETYEDICLGTAFFDWGPAYLDIVQDVDAGRWEPGWVWRKPVSLDTDRSIVRFTVGAAFARDQQISLARFRADLNVYNTNALVPTSFPLWQGPLRLQNGTLLADEGELVNLLDVWYLPQLLEGMEGESADYNALG